MSFMSFGIKLYSIKAWMNALILSVHLYLFFYLSLSPCAFVFIHLLSKRSLAFIIRYIYVFLYDLSFAHTDISLRLSLSLYLCISLYLSLCIFVSLSISLSVSLYLSLSLSLFLFLSFSLFSFFRSLSFLSFVLSLFFLSFSLFSFFRSLSLFFSLVTLLSLSFHSVLFYLFCLHLSVYYFSLSFSI